MQNNDLFWYNNDIYRVLEIRQNSTFVINCTRKTMPKWCESASFSDTKICTEQDLLLLFKVISDRSEKSTTIVTTYLPFSKWTELFENTTMVAALIYRLIFRSHVLDMNGDSYRLKANMQNKA